MGQRLVLSVGFDSLFLAPSSNCQLVKSHSHKESNVQKCTEHFALSLQQHTIATQLQSCPIKKQVTEFLSHHLIILTVFKLISLTLSNIFAVSPAVKPCFWVNLVLESLQSFFAVLLSFKGAD